MSRPRRGTSSSGRSPWRPPIPGQRTGSASRTARWAGRARRRRSSSIRAGDGRSPIAAHGGRSILVAFIGLVSALAVASSVFAQGGAGVTLTKVPIPTAGGSTLSADILDIDQQAHRLYVTDKTSGGIDV